MTGSVDGLLDTAYAKQDNPLNPDELLKVATSETSPLEKDLKDQLKDTFDLVRGARAQELVNKLNVLLNENHMEIISKMTGVSFNRASLEDALGQHRKLLADRGISNSDYPPYLFRSNFGEALAALSQRTEDPTKKRHLEALALGYATGMKFEPEKHGVKAGDVLMALLLDTEDAGAIVDDIFGKGERANDDVLTKQMRRVFDKVVNPSEKNGYNTIFYRQRISAHEAIKAREKAAQVEMSAADKAKVEEISNELDEMAKTQPIKVPQH